MESVEQIDGNVKVEREREFPVLQAEEQRFIYVKRPGVYNCDLRRKDLFYSFVAEIALQLSRRGAEWEAMPGMVDYNACG